MHATLWQHFTAMHIGVYHVECVATVSETLKSVPGDVIIHVGIVRNADSEGYPFEVKQIYNKSG